MVLEKKAMRIQARTPRKTIQKAQFTRETRPVLDQNLYIYHWRENEPSLLPVILLNVEYPYFSYPAVVSARRYSTPHDPTPRISHAGEESRQQRTFQHVVVVRVVIAVRVSEHHITSHHLTFHIPFTNYVCCAELKLGR